MTRIINIAGNSGSGKTILALNLSIALNNQGRDVILVDSDIYSPDITNYTDISPGIFFNEVLEGERNIEEAIMFHPSGIKIVPSIAEEEYSPEKHDKINHALLSLIGKSEIVLVDSFSHNPASVAIIDKADETLFITNDDFPSIVKTKDFINKMENSGINVIGVVLNKRKKETDKKHIEAILNKPVLAEIPHDNKIIDSINAKKPHYLTYPNSDVSKAIRGLAELIDLENNPIKK